MTSLQQHVSHSIVLLLGVVCYSWYFFGSLPMVYPSTVLICTRFCFPRDVGFLGVALLSISTKEIDAFIVGISAQFDKALYLPPPANWSHIYTASS